MRKQNLACFIVVIFISIALLQSYKLIIPKSNNLIAQNKKRIYNITVYICNSFYKDNLLYFMAHLLKRITI